MEDVKTDLKKGKTFSSRKAIFAVISGALVALLFLVSFVYLKNYKISYCRTYYQTSSSDTITSDTPGSIFRGSQIPVSTFNIQLQDCLSKPLTDFILK